MEKGIETRVGVFELDCLICGRAMEAKVEYDVDSYGAGSVSFHWLDWKCPDCEQPYAFTGSFQQQDFVQEGGVSIPDEYTNFGDSDE